jgi:hypothetical protein
MFVSTSCLFRKFYSSCDDPSCNVIFKDRILKREFRLVMQEMAVAVAVIAIRQKRRIGEI